MTIKEKFSSIDQSKLTAEQKSFLSKIKNVTKDFSIKDKDVNDKVEGALDKMIATLKDKMPEAIKSTSTARPKKRSVMSVAKDIRKDGEDFTEAKKRATKKIAEDKESAKKTIKSELDKLNDFIKSRKTLSDIKGTNLLRDAKRKAKPVGRRLSKTGRVYYEYRDSKTDRLSPNYPKNAPYLELGGSVVTDLAGHTGGGNGGFNARVPLDGFSNTAYSGLVGETGAMSSGEMFMNGGFMNNVYAKGGEIVKGQEVGLKFDSEYHKDTLDVFVVEEIKNGIYNLRGKKNGNRYSVPKERIIVYSFANGGSVAMANQQVIDDASQGYVNYYLGEGTAQGIFKDGGAIMNQYEGKTPEEVWNMWTEKQKQHFLVDHFNHFIVEEFKGKNLIDISRLQYKKLPLRVRLELDFHVNKGQYAKGGGVRKVGNREYSYGRNWTNDHRHVNDSENHEVKYTRKGKFLGIFNDGGAVEDIFLAKRENIIEKINEAERNYSKDNGKAYNDALKEMQEHRKLYYEKLNESERNFSKDNGAEYNRLIAIKDFFSKGGSVTNERKHVNKDEDYEVRYSKPKPSRKGYLGKRDFMAGGMVEKPRIYVADLEAYNSGKLVGEWLDLTDYNDADELMEAIQNVLKKSGGEEYAIHDYEYLPSSMYSEYMGYKDFVEIYEMMDLANEKDLPLDVVMDIVSQFDRSALDEFQGVYDSEQDFAEQLVDDIGIQSFIDFEYYLEISDTDRRLLSQEMADIYADNIRDEDGGNRLIEEGGLDVDEYEEADNDRQEEMLDEAREIVYDEYYNNFYDSLNDPYNFLVEEQGLYDADSFVNANFVRVDYEKLGDALEQDYTFVRHDGQIYVFNIR